MTAALAAPGFIPTQIPRWVMPVKAGRITIVETVEGSEFPTITKVLKAWKQVYKMVPYSMNYGSEIIPSCSQGLANGRVIVARDSLRIPQALVRLATSDKGLFVKEVIVAPWNNTACRGFLEANKSLLLRSPVLVELATSYHTDMDTLTTASQGTGTLMIYAACKLVKVLKKTLLSLTTLSLSSGFYTKLGMHSYGLKSFYLDVSRGISEQLLNQLQKYFPEGVFRR